MPIFSYKVIADTGEKSSGLVEAPTLDAAARVLHEHNFFIISIKSKIQFLSGIIPSSLHRASSSDVVKFTRQLSIMLNAGLPLTLALSVLEQQTDNEAMAKVTNDILRKIEGGSSFSKAIEYYPNLFSRVYIALTRAGEAAGVLEQVMHRLADNLEKSKELRSKIKGALIYPFVLIIGMVVVFVLMMVFVIPKLSSLYKDLGASLPLPTRILMFISTFMSKYFIIIIALAAVIGFFLTRWFKTPLGCHIKDSLLLRIPVLGQLQKESALIEFTRTLGFLAAAGVPMIDALTIVTESLENVHYQEAMREIITKVEKGYTLSEPIKENPLFPPIVSNMVAIGEETGKIDDTLLKISNYFEQNVDQSVKVLTTLMEPLIMVILGVGVGFMVWAIITPIYSITSQIK